MVCKVQRLILAQALTMCIVDPAMFLKCTCASIITLDIYVDSILVTMSDTIGIAHMKAYLWKTPHHLRLGQSKVFSEHRVCMSVWEGGH